MTFGYFSEAESEQFAFYRIPQVLFKDERFSKLSTDAKVLYGLFLNRVSLSKKNHWIDEDGRVYVYYTLENIQEDLSCASQKAMKLLKELERYGLIERVKQGLCKPDRIYVKNFILYQKSPVRSGENHQTGVVKITSQDYRKSPSNNTEINNTDISDTNPILSGRDVDKDERSDYREYLIEQLDMAVLYERYPYDREILDSILDMMLDVICSKRKTIRIAGDDKPVNVVKSQFMKLNCMHVEYVMGCLKNNPTKVRNIKQYLLATIYNAPLTMQSYYQAWVNNDMAEGRI